MKNKRARLLAQYTQKKLLHEEKKILLEKLSNDFKQRKEVLSQYEKKKDKNLKLVVQPLNKRREKEALYEKALEEKPLINKSLALPTLSLEYTQDPATSDNEDWDGFLECSEEVLSSVPIQKRMNGNDDEIDPILPTIDFTIGKNPIEGSSIYRLFNRTDNIQSSRELLPILAEEQSIIEMIRYNDISFICGETGSGKTTQLPQFLLEAGFSHPSSSMFSGKIIITQPRRVAAISMASRVALELGVSHEFPKELGKDLVSYKVRYDSTTMNILTKVIFMTDGILLRMIANDFILSSYSVIIIDEAHERNVNTDLLLGLLTRIVALRRKKYENGTSGSIGPLKLVIMSATLRTSEFIENPRLFPNKPTPPLINISSRQYPVTIHFSRVTPPDLLGAAYKKIVQIHKSLPPGGILVFVTGQDEVWTLINRLKREKTALANRGSSKSISNTLPINYKYDDNDIFSTDLLEEEGIITDPEQLLFPETLNSDGDADDEEDADFELRSSMKILPFYSLLTPQDQDKVLQVTSDSNERVVIISTNLAETSITIPGISYVVDTGRVKKRTFDNNGIESFRTNWISKASASQRAGRAGRIGPGHVYRLYSSAIYEDLFEEYDVPEILSIPAESKYFSFPFRYGFTNEIYEHR